MPWPFPEWFQSQSKRRSPGARALGLWLALGLSSASLSAEPGQRMIDGIAAQVGDKVVLVSEVNQLAAPIEARMRAQGQPMAQMANVRKEILERLIEEKLVANMVNRLEMEASAEDVDNAIAGIAQETGMTVAQLEASVESHGLKVSEYREKIRGEIERSNVIGAMVSQRIRIDPAEVKQLYTERYGDQKQGGSEVRLRHILIGAGEGNLRDSRTACMIAADVGSKIRTGQLDFNEAARRFTEMNPEQEGELGWLHMDEMAPWMVKAIKNLEEGGVSEPIAMSFGCNLLEVVKRQQYKPITYEQAEGALSNELRRQKMDREYLAWIDELREQVYVSRRGQFSEGAPPSVYRSP